LTIEQTGQNGQAEHSVRLQLNQHLSFETLLDEICERLKDTRQQGSLRRIRRLYGILDTLEQELNELAACQTNSGQEPVQR